MGRSALIVLDVQKAFDDPAWGARNNPDCERNIAALIGTWRDRGSPVVFVRHDGLEEESPYDTLGRKHPGNALKEVLEGEPDLLVTKHVNSAFHGSPDLEAWLRANGVDAITVCGIPDTDVLRDDRARGRQSRLRDDLRDLRHPYVRSSCLRRRDLRADEVARVTASNLDPAGAVATTAELTG